ncbi:MAG: ATP-binding protein [Elusimicrobia bacterium]|nr:ATP-binding protein [Candidatus Liberimonas magnetica]
MDTNLLKRLIVEHKEKFLLKSGELIEREVSVAANKLLSQKEIIVIMGVRRCGKSSLMRMTAQKLLDTGIKKENILYVNFEDERFIDFDYNDFDALYESFLELNKPKGKKYFFLDEIQNIKSWEKWVNRLYEFEDVKIFVTGSNTSMLSSHVSSALTGRNRQITMYPFSFTEFLTLKKIDFSKNDLYSRNTRLSLKNSLNEYIQYGGFPEVAKNGDASLLEQYFKDILYRDVIAGHSIRNSKEIKELTLYLASNIGSIYSYKNLKEMIEVKSLNTVKNYIDILEGVFLFFRLDIFDYSIKRQIFNPSKTYMVDHALSSAVGFKVFDNNSRIYENIVYTELLRNNKEVYYWKSKAGKEVDFLVREGTNISSAIQVSFSVKDKKTRERELSAMSECIDTLKPKSIYLITENEEGEEKVKNSKIKIVPLWQWLASKGID